MEKFYPNLEHVGRPELGSGCACEAEEALTLGEDVGGKGDPFPCSLQLEQDLWL